MMSKWILVLLLGVQLARFGAADDAAATEGPVRADSEDSAAAEPEESHEEEHEAHWSYHGEYYPAKWYELYALCSAQSPRQSPIDIEPGQTVFEDRLQTISLAETIDRRYTSMDLTNNGHSVNLGVPHEAYIQGGNLPSDGYMIAGVHFHWGSSDRLGSEHTVQDEQFPLEMHMVSYDTDRFAEVGDAVMGYNSLAVLGTMFYVTKEDNPLLNPIIDGLKRVRTPGSTTTISHFPLSKLLPPYTNKYFRYLGSLTTPPCAESVIWTLFLHTQGISSSQLEEFRLLLSSESTDENVPSQMVDNWRPTQALYDRVVYRSFLFKSEVSSPEDNPDNDDHNSAGRLGSTIHSVILGTLSSIIIATKFL